MPEQDKNKNDLAPLQTGLFAKARQWLANRWQSLKGLLGKTENNTIIENQNTSGELAEEQLDKVTAGNPILETHEASYEELLSDLGLSNIDVTVSNNDELSAEDLDNVTAGTPIVQTQEVSREELLSDLGLSNIDVPVSNNDELSAEDLDNVTAGITYDDEDER